MTTKPDAPTPETRDAATCRHCGCVDPLSPPAGVVVWVARDDDGDMSLYLEKPWRTDRMDEDYWYGPSESRIDDDAVEPIAKALGLAPGECARVRLVREGA